MHYKLPFQLLLHETPAGAMLIMKGVQSCQLLWVPFLVI